VEISLQDDDEIKNNSHLHQAKLQEVGFKKELCKKICCEKFD